MCNLSNTNSWDTESAVLIGVGVGAGGDSGLDGIINIPGVNAPFVQDETGQIWEDFLGRCRAIWAAVASICARIFFARLERKA